MSTVDPRIAAYVAEVSRPGIPYVSTSQDRLMGLYVIHGERVVTDLLTAHWAKQREAQQAIPCALRAL